MEKVGNMALALNLSRGLTSKHIKENYKDKLMEIMLVSLQLLAANKVSHDEILDRLAQKVADDQNKHNSIWFWLEELNPSDFDFDVYGSVFSKRESENLARSIFLCLAAKGDTWRRLSFEEYNEYMLSKGYQKEFLATKEHFEQVVPYTVSPRNAAEFSAYYRKKSNFNKTDWKW